MKRHWITVLALILALASTLSDLAWAGDKGLNGGGGEVEFNAIRNELVGWMDARLREGKLGAKLELGKSGLGIPEHELHSRFMKAIERVGDRVKFRDKAIQLPGFSTNDRGRICANSSSEAYIICNNANWAKASAQAKYAIVLHEYLGVAEIESNQGEYSRYPVSSNIVHFVKRSEKYELGAESTILTDCPSLGLDGKWSRNDEDQYVDPSKQFSIQQKGCKLRFRDPMARIDYIVPLDGSEGRLPDAFFEYQKKKGKPDYLKDVVYTVSIDSYGFPVVKVKGVSAHRDWFGTFDVELDVKVMVAGPDSGHWPVTILLSASNLKLTLREGNTITNALMRQALVFANLLLERAPRLNALFLPVQNPLPQPQPQPQDFGSR